MSTSTISNVFFLFPTQPKKKISAVTVRRFPPNPSNPRLLSLGLRCTASEMSSVAARGSSRVEGSGGGCFEQVEEPSKRTEGSGGKRPAVAPGGSSIIEGIAFIALVVFENFVKIVASGIAFIALVGIAFIALVVCLVYQVFVKIAVYGITFIAPVVYLGYQAFVKIAVYGIGFILLGVSLGYQTSMRWLSKIANIKENWVQSTPMEDYKGDYKGLIISINGHIIEKVGELWIWEHTVGCKGLDLEQIHVRRSTVHSVLTQHPSTFDVKSHVELASTKYDQAERMVRFTCKILAQDIKAFHKVTEELWIGIKTIG